MFRPLIIKRTMSRCEFSKYLGVGELSRDLVLTFIKKITCYDNNRFEVEYTFTDELAKLMDLIEERGADVA